MNARRRRSDLLGRVELGGLGLWCGVLLGLEVADLLRADHSTLPTPALEAAVALGVAACIAVMALTAREWRRHGGRPSQRMGLRTLLTGRLPEHLPQRMAVLRDLQRRQSRLTRSWLPFWIPAVCWTVLLADRLTSRPTALQAAVDIGLWITFAAAGVLDLIDRLSRNRLADLVDDLRTDPIGAHEVGAAA